MMVEGKKDNLPPFWECLIKKYINCFSYFYRDFYTQEDIVNSQIFRGWILINDVSTILEECFQKMVILGYFKQIGSDYSMTEKGYELAKFHGFIK